jgi:hypothetical protein
LSNFPRRAAPEKGLVYPLMIDKTEIYVGRNDSIWDTLASVMFLGGGLAIVILNARSISSVRRMFNMDRSR